MGGGGEVLSEGADSSPSLSYERIILLYCQTSAVTHTQYIGDYFFSQYYILSKYAEIRKIKYMRFLISFDHSI